jgi:hypothetical protein
VSEQKPRDEVNTDSFNTGSSNAVSDQWMNFLRSVLEMAPMGFTSAAALSSGSGQMTDEIIQT